MTIAAAYLTSDGLVLGADSKATFTTPAGEKQLLDHAQKIYEIGSNSQLGLCTFGAGKIGDLTPRTISALIGDRLAGASPKVESAVDALVAILDARAKGGSLPAGFLVGYYVGGIEPETRTPKCYRVMLSVRLDQTTQALVFEITKEPLAIGACRFDGAPQYFIRLFNGCADGLPSALLAELKRLIPQGLPLDFEPQFALAFQNIAPNFVSHGVADMPLREAIDFVHAYLQITVKAFKFKIGPPPCGGPIEIAYISTDRPFRWAKHKPFDSAIHDNEAHHGTY